MDGRARRLFFSDAPLIETAAGATARTQFCGLIRFSLSDQRCARRRDYGGTQRRRATGRLPETRSGVRRRLTARRFDLTPGSPAGRRFFRRRPALPPRPTSVPPLSVIRGPEGAAGPGRAGPGRAGAGGGGGAAGRARLLLPVGHSPAAAMAGRAAGHRPGGPSQRALDNADALVAPIGQTRVHCLGGGAAIGRPAAARAAGWLIGG